MKKLILAIALAAIAAPAIAQTMPELDLPAGAQAYGPLPAECGIVAIIIYADGKQQAVTSDGTIRAIEGNEFNCLMQVLSEANG